MRVERKIEERKVKCSCGAMIYYSTEDFKLHKCTDGIRRYGMACLDCRNMFSAEDLKWKSKPLVSFWERVRNWFRVD